MAAIDRVAMEDDQGNVIGTLFVESKAPIEVPVVTSTADGGDDYETYGLTNDVKVKLKDVHDTIRSYALYAIGAFRNLGGAEVEEMTLKFGLKVAGKAGLPVLSEGSAEGNFEIEVKCKFKP